MLRCVRCANEMPALSVFCLRCQHPNEPDFKQLINQILNQRFQLYRQLGEGGLSTVFAAIDLQTDQTVVVKVSDPRHLTQTNFSSDAERQEARQYWAEMTERMQREVTALTHVQHPNIVKVLAAGTISTDLSYVVMELLRGQTLRDEMNVRRRLPVREAIAIATEVATALSIIHAQGIVHRDLTPRNIFLCETSEGRGGEGEKGRRGEKGTLFPPLPHSPTSLLPLSPALASSVKLIDFGIAKFPKQPGAQTYTQHAVMAGTPGYASPEQFQNLPVDHRADIYSLGVMLYEMVTGEKPFTGRSATEIALKQLRDEAIRPRLLVPDLPMRLEALILRALAKDPAVRQQSAEEFAAELKAISARIEVPLRAPLPAPVLVAAEPSATEVFTLLSEMVAKPEPPPARPIPPVEKLVIPPPHTELPEVKLELPPPRRHRTLLAAAGLALLFVVATWLWAGQNAPLPSQAFLPATPTPPSTAAPTPTLRPDVTAPRNSAPAATNREPLPVKQPVVEKAAPILATQRPPAPSLPAPAKPPPTANKTPAQTARPTATPTPQIAAARVPPVAIPQPPVRVEPTPSPAPPPVRNEPRETSPNNTGIDTGGWKREPAPPRRAEPTPAPREAIVMEPKVIPWQGRVNGSREVMLEMPGVPGMVDIPRNFRKNVGIIEPPSPSNGWRRAVLRVFGNGDVSVVIRWWPHRSAAVRQEIVQLSRLR